MPWSRSIPCGRSLVWGRYMPWGRSIPCGRSLVWGRCMPWGRSIPCGRSLVWGRSIHPTIVLLTVYTCLYVNTSLLLLSTYRVQSMVRRQNGCYYFTII